MYTISINGTQLTFDDQGLDNGPAILLLTGWGTITVPMTRFCPTSSRTIASFAWTGAGTVSIARPSPILVLRNNFQMSSACSMLSASGHSSQSRTPTPAGRHWNWPTGWAQRGYLQ